MYYDLLHWGRAGAASQRWSAATRRSSDGGVPLVALSASQQLLTVCKEATALNVWSESGVAHGRVTTQSCSVWLVGTSSIAPPRLVKTLSLRVGGAAAAGAAHGRRGLQVPWAGFDGDSHTPLLLGTKWLPHVPTGVFNEPAAEAAGDVLLHFWAVTLSRAPNDAGSSDELGRTGSDNGGGSSSDVVCASFSCLCFERFARAAPRTPRTSVLPHASRGAVGDRRESPASGPTLAAAERVRRFFPFVAVALAAGGDEDSDADEEEQAVASEFSSEVACLTTHDLLQLLSSPGSPSYVRSSRAFCVPPAQQLFSRAINQSGLCEFIAQCLSAVPNEWRTTLRDNTIPCAVVAAVVRHCRRCRRLQK
jgi:hypothetical protein